MQNKIRHTSGFTLIEMCIVIIILGFMMATSFTLYKQYQDHKNFEKTNFNQSTVIAAITSYRDIHDRYPCPAPLNATRGSVEYGRETNCLDTSIAAGSCADGICIEESERTVDIGAGGASNVIRPRIRVGALPFRQLGLSESMSYDGYGGRFTYAVTEVLAGAADFDPKHGGISIINSDNESILTPDSSAHFIIFSHGQNKAGAYLMSGTQSPCPATGIEAENCTPALRSVYMLAEQSESAANTYDDLVSYFAFEDIPLWQSSDLNRSNIFQKYGGGIGLGFLPDVGVSQEGMDIQGIVRVNDNPATAAVEGSVQAGSYCQGFPFSTDCFASNKIAGQLSEGEGMDCPPGQFMMGVNNGESVCANEYWVTCPDDQFVVGVLDQTVICEDQPQPPEPEPLGCGSMLVEICSQSEFLTAAPHGSQQTVSAGDSAQEIYECNDGVWSLIDELGVCVCGALQSQTFNCEVGYQGTITETRQMTCPGGEYTEWTEDSNDCVCVGETETLTENCPNNLSGSVFMERYFQCATEEWTAWQEVGSNCECTEQSETQAFPCDNDFTGGIERVRELSCPSATWSDWTEVENTCECIELLENRQVACAEGQTGHMTEVRNLTCPGGIWTAWSLSETTCQSEEASCQWVASGSVQDSNTFIGALAGSACSCGDMGPCSSSPGGSLKLNYSNCICQ